MVTMLTTLARQVVHGQAVQDLDAATQDEATQKLADLLEQAHDIGVAYATSQLPQRAISFKRPVSFLSQAAGIITHFVERLKDWVANWIGGAESSAEAEAPPFEDALDAFVANTADLAATWEIPSTVEAAVMETWQRADVPDVVWVDEEGSCAKCRANAAQGPVPIGTAFVSGDVYPPGHNRCRCSLSMS